MRGACRGAREIFIALGNPSLRETWLKSWESELWSQFMRVYSTLCFWFFSLCYARFSWLILRENILRSWPLQSKHFELVEIGINCTTVWESPHSQTYKCLRPATQPTPMKRAPHCWWFASLILKKDRPEQANRN